MTENAKTARIRDLCILGFFRGGVGDTGIIAAPGRSAKALLPCAYADAIARAHAVPTPVPTLLEPLMKPVSIPMHQTLRSKSVQRIPKNTGSKNEEAPGRLIPARRHTRSS